MAHRAELGHRGHCRGNRDIRGIVRSNCSIRIVRSNCSIRAGSAISICSRTAQVAVELLAMSCTGVPVRGAVRHYSLRAREAGRPLLLYTRYRCFV